MADVESSSSSSTSSPSPSRSGGTYAVTESGIQFHHAPQKLPTPASTSEFISRLQSNFLFRVLSRPSPNEVTFEIKGIDISFANALRRIMIAEIPTIALENVYMWNNSGLIHDEVLSHRLGLVPLNVDPRLFEDYGEDCDDAGEPLATDRNTVVFKLKVECGRNQREDDKIQKNMLKTARNDGFVSGYNEKDEEEMRRKREKEKQEKKSGDDNDEMEEEEEEDSDPSVMNLSVADKSASEASSLHSQQQSGQSSTIDATDSPFTKHVYTKDLLWAPQGDQLERFPLHSGGASGIGGIRPIHEDILIAKLRPGQAIELEAHGIKGYGSDHAKYSPVATASYRLMPHIEVVKPIYDGVAEELVNWFEPGVFSLVPLEENDEGSPEHKVKAVVTDPYACTMSRNFMRHPVLKESIKMSRVPDHFIFNVESVGMMEPGVIVAEALKVLKAKANKVLNLAEESLAMGL